MDIGDSFGTAHGRKSNTILADPPWQFTNRTGKMAPEHKRLNRYATMGLKAICELPVRLASADPSHLYLWVPNAMLPDGLEVMKAWGFTYKANIIWHKVRKDGGPDGRGVGFYFRGHRGNEWVKVDHFSLKSEAASRSAPSIAGIPHPASRRHGAA